MLDLAYEMTDTFDCPDTFGSQKFKVNKLSVPPKSVLYDLSHRLFCMSLKLLPYHEDLLHPGKRPFVATQVVSKLPINARPGADELHLIAQILACDGHNMFHAGEHQVEHCVLPEVRKGFVAALSAGLR